MSKISEIDVDIYIIHRYPHKSIGSYSQMSFQPNTPSLHGEERRCSQELEHHYCTTAQKGTVRTGCTQWKRHGDSMQQLAPQRGPNPASVSVCDSGL